MEDFRAEIARLHAELRSAGYVITLHQFFTLNNGYFLE